MYWKWSFQHWVLYSQRRFGLDNTSKLGAQNVGRDLPRGGPSTRLRRNASVDGADTLSMPARQANAGLPPVLRLSSLRSGQLVDPVRTWRRDRTERPEIVGECLEVVAAVKSRFRNRRKRGEVVPAIGEEVIHRDVVRCGRIKRYAVQLNVAHGDRCTVTGHDGLCEIVSEAL
jgi:hypothetical protein